MEPTTFRPIFAAAPTLVGSFPHADPQRLMDRIFDRFAELPAWPQLPARDWLESMYVQYSERLPGAVIDRPGQRIHLRASAKGFSPRNLKCARALEEAWPKEENLQQLAANSPRQRRL